MSIRLSKSALDKFVNCPRCFYLKYKNKVDQPDMISSKVWKGIERICSAHYEKHRLAKTTPDNLIGQVPEGAIPYQGDRIDMKALRYWGKGLAFRVEGIDVTTALDDMIQVGEYVEDISVPKYNVIDWKSKSKPTDEKSTDDLYQNQADVFDTACNVNGYPTDHKVYFDYWFPISVLQSSGKEVLPDDGSEGHGLTTQHWGSQVIVLQADQERCKRMVLAAAACLESSLPDPKLKVGKIPGCPVCEYTHDLNAFLGVAA